MEKGKKFLKFQQTPVCAFFSVLWFAFYDSFVQLFFIKIRFFSKAHPQVKTFVLHLSFVFVYVSPFPGLKFQH